MLKSYLIQGKLLLGLVLLGLAQGCNHLIISSATHSPRIPAQTFQFQDGGTSRYFSFDKRLAWSDSAAPHTPPASYLFVVSGSDCIDMQTLLPDYFRGLEGESGPIRIFILQKRFIQPFSQYFFSPCSNEFIQADHPSRWIADQTEFIADQLAQAVTQGEAPQRVALLGISEGGDIIAALAQRIPHITHLAMVGNGGMNTLDAYRLQAEKHGFSEQLEALDALDQIPTNPDAKQHFIAGRSWRYWSELRELQQSRQLLALQIPILIGMGENDQSVPVASALHTRALFKAHQRQNLTVLIYPGADHGLRSSERHYLQDYFFVLDKHLQK